MQQAQVYATSKTQSYPIVIFGGNISCHYNNHGATSDKKWKSEWPLVFSVRT